jgi:hypothetical protein
MTRRDLFKRICGVCAGVATGAAVVKAAPAEVGFADRGARYAPKLFCGLLVHLNEFPTGDRIELKGVLPTGCTIGGFPLAGFNKPLTFNVGIQVLEECRRLGITPVKWHLTAATWNRILIESMRFALPSFARYQDYVERTV